MLKGVSWRPIGSTLPLHPSWVFKVPQHFSNSFIIINSFPFWISHLFLSFSKPKENILVPSQNSSFMPLWRTKELIWRPPPPMNEFPLICKFQSHQLWAELIQPSHWKHMYETSSGGTLLVFERLHFLVFWLKNV